MCVCVTIKYRITPFPLGLLPMSSPFLSRTPIFTAQRVATQFLPAPIVLFYNYRVGPSGGAGDPAGTEVRFQVEGEGDDNYRGLSFIPMASKADGTYSDPPEFFISFLGNRVAGREAVPEFGIPAVPSFYDETVEIKRAVPIGGASAQGPTDEIRAHTKYVEPDSTSGETQIDFVTYPVLFATGIFQGARFLDIQFINEPDIARRTVTIR